MKKHISFFSLVIFLVFSCDSNRGSKHSLFLIPSVSLSSMEAYINGTLISCYDLEIKIGIDETILLDKYSWLEYKWHKSNKTGRIIIDSSEAQLIIPVSKNLTKCSNYTKCNFEIYDDHWKSPGLKGDNFYYTCKNLDDLSKFKLWVEVNGEKESDLLFNKTICAEFSTTAQSTHSTSKAFQHWDN